MKITCSVGAAEFVWEIEQLADGPGDAFALIDEDGTPRVVLTAEELTEVPEPAKKRAGRS